MAMGNKMPNKGEQAEYRHALMLYKLTQNPVAAEALFGPDACEGITLINQETKKQIESAEKDLNTHADMRLLVCTKPRESGFGKKKPELFELHLGGSLEDKWNYAKEKLGLEISPADVFKEGDWVDASDIVKVNKQEARYVN